MSRARRRSGLAAALAAAAILVAALAATAASGAYGVAGTAAVAAASPSSASARRGGGGGGSFFLGSGLDGEESSGETATTSPYIVELVPGSDDAAVTSLCERLEAGHVGGGNGSGSGSGKSPTPASSSGRADAAARCGRHLYRSVFLGALVHASPGTASALAKEPGVASVHPDDLVTLHSGGNRQEKRRGGGAGADTAAANLRLFSSPSADDPPSLRRSASSLPGYGYPLTQLDAPWHLARLSSPEPLSERRTKVGARTGGERGEAPPFSLELSAAGTGVSVFVVDTGVLAGHAEFRWSPALAPSLSEGSSPSSPSSSAAASRVRRGFSVFEGDQEGAADCVGHGTHVAALAAGLTFGLAKNATVVPVRVVGCDGAAAVSDVVAGLDWISSVLLSGNGREGGGGGGGESGDDNGDDSGGGGGGESSYSLPAVVSLSVGSSRPSPALDRAAQALVDAGALVVAAAGNAAADACGASPGRLPSAVTVAASDELDGVWPSSNHGPCVDLHAPGVNVTSATSVRSGIGGGDGAGAGAGEGAGGGSGRGGGEAALATNTAEASGTSMAAPVVSGAAAVFMEAWPGATPAEVHERLVSSAARGVLRWRGSGDDAAAAAAAASAEANTANLLLQSPPPPRPALVVSPSSMPPAILFEPAPGRIGGGEEEEDGREKQKQRGVSRERLALSLPPSSWNLEHRETPFEVKVDFFAAGAPAGWLSASPSSGVLTRENPTATIELVFDASAAAGFSSFSSSSPSSPSLSSPSSSSLSADVVVTSRNKLAARRRASARVFCSRLALAPRGGARRVTRMEFLESWDEATGPPRKKRGQGGGGGPGSSSSSPSSSSSSSSFSSSSPWVSATLAVALSHPVAVPSLPEGSFVVNGGAGEVVSIARGRGGGGAEEGGAGGGGGGRSCSEWVVRVRAPAPSSSSSSTPSPSSFPSARLCVSLSPRGVFDVWGAPFGALEGKRQPDASNRDAGSSSNCTTVRLAPRLRLFAPFAAAAAPAGVVASGSSSNLLSVEAEVGPSEEGRVLLLLASSEPVSGLDVSSFDVAIDRRTRRGDDDKETAGVVLLSPVVAKESEQEKGNEKDGAAAAAAAAAAATLWHAVLQLPAGYQGPVVVSLRTEGIRSSSSVGGDESGGPRAGAPAAASAAPSAPLALRAVAAPLLRPTGFQLLL